MRSIRDIERLVSRFRLPADAGSRRRILSDAMRAIEGLQPVAEGHRGDRVLFGPLVPAHLLKMAGLAALVTVTAMAAQYLLFLLQLRLEYPYSF